MSSESQASNMNQETQTPNTSLCSKLKSTLSFNCECKYALPMLLLSVNLSLLLLVAPLTMSILLVTLPMLVVSFLSFFFMLGSIWYLVEETGVLSPFCSCMEKKMLHRLVNKCMKELENKGKSCKCMEMLNKGLKCIESKIEEYGPINCGCTENLNKILNTILLSVVSHYFLLPVVGVLANLVIVIALTLFIQPVFYITFAVVIQFPTCVVSTLLSMVAGVLKCSLFTNVTTFLTVVVGVANVVALYKFADNCESCTKVKEIKEQINTLCNKVYTIVVDTVSDLRSKAEPKMDYICQQACKKSEQLKNKATETATKVQKETVTQVTQATEQLKTKSAPHMVTLKAKTDTAKVVMTNLKQKMMNAMKKVYNVSVLVAQKGDNVRVKVQEVATPHVMKVKESVQKNVVDNIDTAHKEKMSKIMTQIKECLGPLCEQLKLQGEVVYEWIMEEEEEEVEEVEIEPVTETVTVVEKSENNVADSEDSLEATREEEEDESQDSEDATVTESPRDLDESLNTESFEKVEESMVREVNDEESEEPENEAVTGQDNEDDNNSDTVEQTEVPVENAEDEDVVVVEEEKPVSKSNDEEEAVSDDSEKFQ